MVDEKKPESEDEEDIQLRTDRQVPDAFGKDDIEKLPNTSTGEFTEEDE